MNKILLFKTKAISNFLKFYNSENIEIFNFTIENVSTSAFPLISAMHVKNLKFHNIDIKNVNPMIPTHPEESFGSFAHI